MAVIQVVGGDTQAQDPPSTLGFQSARVLFASKRPQGTMFALLSASYHADPTAAGLMPGLTVPCQAVGLAARSVPAGV